MKKLIPVADPNALFLNNIFFSKKTLSRWWREKRFPGVMVKIFGRIYIDVDAWNQYIETSCR